ncbi:MAG: MotA/TolQ/ExbB proton channel family protein [Synergistaceae bacterium]|jgi:biopolymer transport protein ExbB|nr:MotA/TolQ/ExbB proton channel family protein [Synergistaceae bacterium]
MSQFMFYMDAGGPIMWVILGLSLTGVALLAERFLFFTLAGGRAFSPPETEKDLDGDDLQVLADRCVRAEMFVWQKHLGLLEIIVRVTPMLGLLGTVLGMVEMFRVLTLGTGIDVTKVTGGIRVALFTTVAGLCCAVPLLVASGFLNAAVDRQEERLNRQADAWIQEKLRRK